LKLRLIALFVEKFLNAKKKKTFLFFILLLFLFFFFFLAVYASSGFVETAFQTLRVAFVCTADSSKIGALALIVSFN
jgi:hypothetical protein